MYQDKHHNNLFSCFLSTTSSAALLAFSYWLEQKHAHLIWACGVAVLIFRSELCLLLGTMLLADLSTQRLQLLPCVIAWVDL